MPHYAVISMAVLLTLAQDAVAAGSTAVGQAGVDWEKLTPVLLGAGFAVLGGLVTQGIVLWLNRRHERVSLQVGLRSELRVIRGNLGNALEGYRASLRIGEAPRPDVFLPSMPVFTANAAKLGQFGDADLVEHVVEAYDGLYSLKEKCQFFARIANKDLTLRDLNEVHMSATIAHLEVIKLHNRLLGTNKNAVLNESGTETETRALVAEFGRELAAGGIAALLARKWADA